MWSTMERLFRKRPRKRRDKDIMDIRRSRDIIPHVLQKACRLNESSPTLELAMNAIINNDEIISVILEKANFSPSELKILATFAADNPMAIRELTRKHGWLAKVPVTPTGLTILHLAISERLPNFTELLKVQTISNNLNPIDINGQTPIMAACKEGRRTYFNDLLMAGAKVDLMTYDMETIYHFLIDNSESEEMLFDLFNQNEIITLPDIEIRRKEDNKTALQLALVKKKIGTAKCLMRYFSASPSTLYGRSTALNTADMVLLWRDDDASDEIYDCTGTEPSMIRLAYAIIDDSVFYNSHVGRWISKMFANSFLKKTGTYQSYKTNATKKEALDNGYSERDVECGICLESLDDHHRTVCSHRFHPRCLNVWLLRYQGNCPICRSPDVSPVSPVSGSPFMLPEKPETPRLNHRPIIHPSQLQFPYPSRAKVDTQQRKDGYVYKYMGLSFENTEYLIGGVWKCESNIVC
nr:MAG: wsv199-like protein [Penaeus semisulcatus pemonivirus]